MKDLKHLVLVTILATLSTSGQNPTPSGTVNICSGITAEDVADYTYFKDINHTFDNFVGTWKWTSGNEVVTFILTKVTQYYFPEDKVFEDYMIGNYSYSTDSGNTYIVNSVSTLISSSPEANPMYTACSETNRLKFVFEDIVLNKNFCSATFEFLPGSLTQMQVKIENPKEILGRLNGEPAYNFDFTLPIEMIVTKQ